MEKRLTYDSISGLPITSAATYPRAAEFFILPVIYTVTHLSYSKAKMDWPKRFPYKIWEMFLDLIFLGTESMW